jgi:hypothetical protein
MVMIRNPTSALEEKQVSASNIFLAIATNLREKITSFIFHSFKQSYAVKEQCVMDTEIEYHVKSDSELLEELMILFEMAKVEGTVVQIHSMKHIS